MVGQADVVDHNVLRWVIAGRHDYIKNATEFMGGRTDELLKDSSVSMTLQVLTSAARSKWMLISPVIGTAIECVASRFNNLESSSKNVVLIGCDPGL